MYKLEQVDIDFPIRLDKYLKLKYQSLTQGQIEQALRKGLIKVNGQKCKAGCRVQKGEELFISELLNFQKFVNEDPKVFSNSIITLSKKIFNDYLLFEHKDFIVINKPSGLSTQGGSKISLSVDDALKCLNQSKGYELRLVHRLDKETSGVLLIAKNYYASIKLTSGFKDKVIEKTYIAITNGIPKNREGTIESFIKPKDKQNEPKLATTRYKVQKAFNNKALIEFSPLTGRMHQIRIHSKELGCPIVGDKKYGESALSKEEPQMFLHAAGILLPKSLFGEEFFIEAPLPSYFKI